MDSDIISVMENQISGKPDVETETKARLPQNAVATVNKDASNADKEAAIAVVTAVEGAPTAGKTPKESPPGKYSLLKPLRTYETDVAELLARTRASTASIAIAEAKKQTGEERLGKTEKSDGRAKHSWAKAIMAIISLVLIGGGAAGAYYLYGQSPLAVPLPPPLAKVASVHSLAPADNKVNIPIDGLSPEAVISAVKAEITKPQEPDTLKEIFLTERSNGPAGTGTDTAGGQETQVPAGNMLSMMDIPAPDILKRTLGNAWMLGVYADGGGNKSVFVIVTTDFFQNAFAGMLQWEASMPDDLERFLSFPETPATVSVAVTPAAAASSTAIASTTGRTAGSGAVSAAATTSSPDTGAAAPAVSYAANVQSGRFENRIVRNKDVRTFVTASGRILFAYSFVDNTRLVLAGSETAIGAIVDRLEKQAYVR